MISNEKKEERLEISPSSSMSVCLSYLHPSKSPTIFFNFCTAHAEINAGELGGLPSLVSVHTVGVSNHFMYKEFHCSRLLDGLTCQGYTVIMAYNYLIFLNLILNLQDLLKYNQVQLTKSDKVAKTAQIEC